MTISELLEQFRVNYSNERDKGTAFENLIKIYLENEPKYNSILSNVWTWKEFPYRDNVGDTGIDLVAETNQGEYWAIQCKFYAEDHVINKSDVDTFLATSSKFFDVRGEKKKFNYRLIAATTNRYNHIAEETLKNQDPEVGRISYENLIDSIIDWNKFFSDDRKVEFIRKHEPREHQKEAIEKVITKFKAHDRGKLIMACGTGKTFTSLRIAEEQLNGKGNILFLVPSIALASQTLTEWSSQCRYSFNAAVVCSDNKASKGKDSVDLGFPSTTDVKRLEEWSNNALKNNRDINFVFSTYQSIDVVSKFQKNTGFEFDLIICDEAHRTTGVTLTDEDESSFVKVHNDDFIKGKKRLYMTATPRVYGEAIKGKANEINAELCSMDDESKYGPVFHNLTFSESVEKGLLTDYKVLVLAVDEEYVKKELQDLLTDENHELKLEDSVKIMGCWNGLSKLSSFNEKDSFSTDPLPMKRAVAFCNRIKDSQKLVEMFRVIQEHVKKDKVSLEKNNLVNISIEHVDGSFNALEKKERINWLKDSIEEGECRILTNARCLSEGVDVPALDAVMFLNPRSSMIDIIQSVGRVMRKSEGKKYGYIILPIGISASEDPDKALDNNDKYKLVWDVLQALRAHDDRFNNTINKIDLNKKRPSQIDIIGIGSNRGQDDDNGKRLVDAKDSIDKNIQLQIDFTSFDEWKDSIYAKMVKRVGSRIYWESWAKDIAQIAQTHVDRIKLLLQKNDKNVNLIFNEFVKGLQKNLNNSINEEDAIEMLAQHIITKPVFDALFEGYEFVKNNPVSQTMQTMMEILDKQKTEEETEKLNKFYNSVKERAKGIDNSEGKQKIILELYEKFFKTALPKEVEKLGIVYTPTECVDFIINSVEHLMQKEFGKSLSDKGVHIIDGFTGTGTFIVRLLQSGIIKKEDLLYKYTNEIHANEIVLLAYYIATINIEETFHELYGEDKYIPFDGIVLTDTFQLYENSEDLEWTKQIGEMALPINSERAKKQRQLPITVCIGNPPYSVGQKSTNDDAQNLRYEILERRIAETYSRYSKVNNINALYDSYIKAFRWASDRIKGNGIISFISNGAFIDNAAMSGMRKCLFDEFTSIYVFNLRGNQRTSGEMSRKEGGKIFGSGSRTPVSITCLVKNSNREKDNCIHYCDIGDYLSRDQKLSIIKNKVDVSSIEWKKIVPDENNDWINKRNNKYSNFTPVEPIRKFDMETKSVFTTYSNGIGTSRDAWVYNFDKNNLKINVQRSLNYYNELIKLDRVPKTFDNKYIHWSSSLDSHLKNKTRINYDENIVLGTYRPFVKENLYFGEKFIHRRGQFEEFLGDDNKFICITGVGANKDFSALMTNTITDYQTMSNCQCFPLYWFEKSEEETLFTGEKIQYDGISDYFKNKAERKYSTNVEKEEIFYYIYALFHSDEYKKEFSSDLKKGLPRIPLVTTYEKFKCFSNYGKKLSDLHLNYEDSQLYENINLTIYPDANYKVNKMCFGKNKDKSTIVFNDWITISNIPSKAYDYIVNGKSAIEWIMERYQVTTDTKSGITNDPNLWCNEKNDEKYIFNLLLKIISVSIKTMDIIESLPKLDME